MTDTAVDSTAAAELDAEDAPPVPALETPSVPAVRMLGLHVYDELPAYKQENGTRVLSKSDTLCVACLEMFGSTTAFDMHRVGKHAYLASPEKPDGRRCLTPEEMEGREMHRDLKGRWRSPAGERWWENAAPASPAS